MTHPDTNAMTSARVRGRMQKLFALISTTFGPLDLGRGSRADGP